MEDMRGGLSRVNFIFTKEISPCRTKVSAMPARWARRSCSFLGLQHMFAMFGATVLVPALTGLSVSATLLFAGLGTLFFHFLTKGKVPAFLGSSFAYLAGYAAIAPNGESRASPLRLRGRRRFRPAVSDSRRRWCAASARTASCGSSRRSSPARSSSASA